MDQTVYSGIDSGIKAAFYLLFKCIGVGLCGCFGFLLGGEFQKTGRIAAIVTSLLITGAAILFMGKQPVREIPEERKGWEAEIFSDPTPAQMAKRATYVFASCVISMLVAVEFGRLISENKKK